MKTIDTKKVKPNTNFIGQNVVYFETTDSTNTVAKQSDYKCYLLDDLFNIDDFLRDFSEE